MTIKNRAQTGKFAAKSEAPRKVRSVNLTDAAWQWLARTAAKAGLSRNDWIEAMAGQQPLMETVAASVPPLMETVAASVPPLMETASEVESLRQSLERSDTLIKSRNQEISDLNSRLAAKDEIIASADEQIEKLESEFAGRSQTPSEASASVGTDLSKVEAADLLNQLKSKRKKSRAELVDMETVLDLLSQLSKE
ncbi:hypothetical protein QUB64_04880 [Microcoleus sp. Aus8_D2]